MSFFLSFFLDELQATSCLVLGVIAFLGVGSRKVSRCVRFVGAIDPEGIFCLKIGI
jgi:hypothetical protein